MEFNETQVYPARKLEEVEFLCWRLQSGVSHFFHFVFFVLPGLCVSTFCQISPDLWFRLRKAASCLAILVDLAFYFVCQLPYKCSFWHVKFLCFYETISRCDLGQQLTLMWTFVSILTYSFLEGMYFASSTSITRDQC